MTKYAFDVDSQLGSTSSDLEKRRRDHPKHFAYNVLVEGENLETGVDDFEARLGAPTSMEKDLLRLAATVFAADRASARGERENLARTFRIRLPVTNVAQLSPLIPLLERALRALSQDSWHITLTSAPGDQEAEPPGQNADGSERGQTLLFSGGLDSLAAAIEFGRAVEPLQLISHVTRNTATRRTQDQLVEALAAQGYNVVHRQFFVSSRNGGPTHLQHAEENTQRTRSFVFLVLGALAARRMGHDRIVYLAENGQMAIHLPLTQGRIGAFSTHTAHPNVLANMEQLLSSALSVSLRIINPYVYRTKREVVSIVHAAQPALIPIANSCWMNARLPAGVTHCGACIPCYVRRIAIESFGADRTAYGRDVWREDVAHLPDNDDGRRNLVDLAEFVRRFGNDSPEALLSEFPDLYSTHISVDEAIAMYKRFSSEAQSVLGNYTAVAAFLL